jgi:hypothetical protein
MGAIHFVFRHLFQTDVIARSKIMSTEFIMMFAIGVFVLMSVGIILTMVEFNKISDDPSVRKGSGGPKNVERATHRANVRIVDSNENVA